VGHTKFERIDWVIQRTLMESIGDFAPTKLEMACYRQVCQVKGAAPAARPKHISLLESWSRSECHLIPPHSPRQTDLGMTNQRITRMSRTK
jgi:hypothetical protein